MAECVRLCAVRGGFRLLVGELRVLWALGVGEGGRGTLRWDGEGGCAWCSGCVGVGGSGDGSGDALAIGDKGENSGAGIVSASGDSGDMRSVPALSTTGDTSVTGSGAKALPRRISGLRGSMSVM